MSIALPYHAWFVGHQTECIGSSLPNSECLYWSQGRTRRRSEQLRRQREDALLVERLDNPPERVARREPRQQVAGRIVAWARGGARLRPGCCCGGGPPGQTRDRARSAAAAGVRMAAECTA
jgi:hypothetical protein